MTRIKYVDDPLALSEREWVRRIVGVSAALHSALQSHAVHTETVEDVQSWVLPFGQAVSLDWSTDTVIALSGAVVMARVEFALPETVVDLLRDAGVSVDAPVDGRAA